MNPLHITEFYLKTFMGEDDGKIIMKYNPLYVPMCYWMLCHWDEEMNVEKIHINWNFYHT